MNDTSLSRDQGIQREIEAVISDLADEYRSIQALILTERDLQCQLHARLSKIPALVNPRPTAQQQMMGSMVHAELSWYDEKGKLTIVPDLSIIEVGNLTIIRSRQVVRLPSKQYSFDGNAIILELKFCRSMRGISNAFFDRYVMRDYDKIMRLHKKIKKDGYADSIYSYLVVFSKYDKRGGRFLDFVAAHQDSHELKIVYGSAGL
jgi:hypothetical protein